jgi:predicted phosphodiesterase
LAALISHYTPVGVDSRNYEEIKNIASLGLGEEFTFAVFGDNQGSRGTFNELLRRVDADPEIQFVISCGDLVPEGDKEKYRFFLGQIEGLGKPLLTTVGNHDIKDKGRALYYDIFGDFYYSFVTSNSYFIILDNANKVRFSQPQKDWLVQELEKSVGYKHKFVFMHVPLYDPRTDVADDDGGIKVYRKAMRHALEDDTESRWAAELFAQYKVTHIFCGHIHAYYTGKWWGVPYTISGGGGGRLLLKDPEHDFFHYLKVKVAPNGVDIEVNELPSPRFAYWARFIHTGYLYGRSFVSIHAYAVSSTIIIIVLVMEFYSARLRGFFAKNMRRFFRIAARPFHRKGVVVANPEPMVDTSGEEAKDA